MDPKPSTNHVFDLLHKDPYTLDEVASVLDLPATTIYSAIMERQLHATVVGDDVTSIARHDLIEWLRQR